MESLYRSEVPLPASVNSRREVCIHPYGDLNGQECRWLEFISQPLRQPFVSSIWTFGQSECDGCNERSIEAFILNLDPRRWVNGLDSPMAWTAFAVEAGIIIAAVLFLTCLFSKVIIPLCCCVKWCCKPNIRRTKSAREQLIKEKF